MARKDVKLTPTSYAVLGLLSHAGAPSTPYDLKRAIEMSVENFWPVPHTTFYAEPARLARAGYLSEQQEDHGRRRKLYALTARGREALAAWVADPQVADPQLRDEGMLKIFLGADGGPVVEHHLAFYRRKLDELTGYLEAMRLMEGSPPGIERSLVAGTAYARSMIAMLEELSATRSSGSGP
jgi:DNA-binding PadR family transcriptional regulator